MTLAAPRMLRLLGAASRSTSIMSRREKSAIAVQMEKDFFPFAGLQDGIAARPIQQILALAKESAGKMAVAAAARVETRGAVSSETAPEFTHVSFLSTCDLDGVELPLPEEHLERIGNTPIVKLQDNGVGGNLYAKLEGHNPGDSLKDRTISRIVIGRLTDGSLALHGDTLVLVTSGSAGVSLVKFHEALAEVEGIDLNVLIVMPEAYAHKTIPAELIEMDSTEVFHGAEALCAHNAAQSQQKNRCQIMLMEGAFIDVLAETREIAAREGWKMLEQHQDANSVLGHRSTVMELLAAVPDLTDVVCSTGTGATAAGLRKFLPDHILVHSRPAESGSIDGLSNVRRYNNFCDAGQLTNYDSCLFDKSTAVEHTAELAGFGIKAGPSSGACYWLAKEIVAEHVADGGDPSEKKVAFICADGSLEGAGHYSVASRRSMRP